MWQGKELQGMKIKEEDVKLFLFTGYITANQEMSKKFTVSLVRLN